MEINELKNIWQTLSDEKLIGKSIAKENIERIIKLNSSKTIGKLTKKLKSDYVLNIVLSAFIFIVTIFASLFLGHRDQHLPIQGYIFLILCFSFYTYKAFNYKSKMALFSLSFHSATILESLKSIRCEFEKSYKKDVIISSVIVGVLTAFANVLLIDNTDLGDYRINSFKGYVLMFSVFYLVALPWLSKLVYRKRFSGILTDIDKSVAELNSEDI